MGVLLRAPKGMKNLGFLKENSHMKFRPLGDRVVVRRVKEDQKTPGGIIIPETAQEKPQEGEVISAGPGALDDSGKRVAPEVKTGDFVLFGKWSGTEVKIDGEELLIMKESDIMGILEGRKASKKS
jgi:chaperonin GroES